MPRISCYRSILIVYTIHVAFAAWILTDVTLPFEIMSEDSSIAWTLFLFCDLPFGLIGECLNRYLSSLSYLTCLVPEPFFWHSIVFPAIIYPIVGTINWLVLMRLYSVSSIFLKKIFHLCALTGLVLGLFWTTMIPLDDATAVFEMLIPPFFFIVAFCYVGFFIMAIGGVRQKCG